MVYEVGLDGEVVRLKNINGPPKPPKAPKEQPAEGGEDGAAAAEQPVSRYYARKGRVLEADQYPQLWNETSEAAISLLLPTAKVEELKAFLLEGPAPNGPKTDPPTPVRSFRSDVSSSPFTVLQLLTKPPGHRSEGGSHGVPSRTPGRFRRTILQRGKGGRGWCSGHRGHLEQARSAKGAHEQRCVCSSALLLSRSRNLAAERQNRNDTKDLPRYIHFTLQKTNKEMHDALSGLTRTLHLQGRDLGTAGTKDKRAVTVQRVSMKRGNKTIEDVWRAAKGGGGGGRGRGRGRGGYSAGGGERGVRIGDLEYKDYGFDLGMLKGNKFVVTLR